jgi:hypothetical protein
MEELLDSSLLVIGFIVELHHLLQQSVETRAKLSTSSPGLKVRFSHSLRSARNDGVPGLLGSPLLGK